MDNASSRRNRDSTLRGGSSQELRNLLRATLGRRRGELLQEGFGVRLIGIKLQYPQCVIPRLLRLVGSAKSIREIQTNVAAIGSLVEYCLPQLHSIRKLAGLGLEHCQLDSCVNRIRVLLQRSLIKITRGSEITVLLPDISQ